MIYLVTLYSILGALAVVLELMAQHWISAFCVAFLTTASYLGGHELGAGIQVRGAGRKLGRILYALILLLISYYLSSYAVNLYFHILPGLWWLLIGASLGLLAAANSLRAR